MRGHADKLERSNGGLVFGREWLSYIPTGSPKISAEVFGPLVRDSDPRAYLQK
jgi:hypothetical protein